MRRQVAAVALATPCDSYSSGCPAPGGELTLLAPTGAGAVAGGTALVLTGRRRSVLAS